MKFNFPAHDLFQWHEADENLDGKKDILQLSITVPLMPTEKVLSTFIVLGFDYKLHVSNKSHLFKNAN